MRIVRGAHAAIGNFDGVHRGHQAVVAAAGGPPGRRAVVTFEPHPRCYFSRVDGPFLLTPSPARERQLERAGVDLLFLFPFNDTLASMPAKNFAGDILGDRLGLRRVAAGADFRFGHCRAGDLATLREVGAERGYRVREVKMAGEGGETFSSSSIRAALREGNPEEAARQLGRWHAIEGQVLRGDGRGRELAMPTANLDPGDALRPAPGIYAVDVEVLEGGATGLHQGVASLGFNPTFGLESMRLEAHLLDFDGDLYGARLAVGLRAWMRAERQFESLDLLASQMRRDAEEARSILARQTPPWES